MTVEGVLFAIVATLGISAYVSAVWQMLTGAYSPSFFSRGVWLLLGVNSFVGVLYGGGTHASTILAATLLIGNAAVFIVSYKKGSRSFGRAEQVSLVLLIVAMLVWLILNAPFITLIISLLAHLIGGLPTIWRTILNPENEQAFHWYFFFVGCIVSIIASPDKSITGILFPLYFGLFDGLIIFLVNRRKLLGIFR